MSYHFGVKCISYKALLIFFVAVLYTATKDRNIKHIVYCIDVPIKYSNPVFATRGLKASGGTTVFPMYQPTGSQIMEKLKAALTAITVGKVLFYESDLYCTLSYRYAEKNTQKTTKLADVHKV